MSKKIQIEYCGMPGEGETLKAAKQSATQRIEALIRDLQAPIFIHWRDDAMMIYRSHCGWEYTCLHGFETKEAHTGAYSGGSCCGFQTREEAERAARQHLADIARREGEMETPAILTEGRLSPSTKRDMAAEYIRRGKQDDENRRRGREADELGLTGNDRYAYIVKMHGWESLVPAKAEAEAA